MNKRIILLLIHFPVWIVTFVVSFFFGTDRFPSGTNLHYFWSTLTFFIWGLGSFYVFYSFLVPRYLEKYRTILFGIYTFLFVLIIIPFTVLIILNVSNLPVLITQQGLLMWLGGVVTTLFCGILGSLYRFSVDWFNNLYLKNEIENIKLRSELNAIKSRLNPHFLFNTLNNIDSLISTNPQKASIVLSMLSDLFRYVVYDTEQEKIAIQKELEIIQKYIDLEKIRITNPDAVSFACAVDNNLLISPMTLIPFIENAFKHSNLNQHNNKVSISVTEKSNELVFRCINSIGMPENENNLKEKGIGLKLIQERLKLLYPNSHHLQIVRQNDEFDVTLKINLIND